MTRVFLIALLVMGAGPSAYQAVDRSKPPPIVSSAEGFTIRRLDGPVVVDGRAWIAVDVVVGTHTIRAPNGQFWLSLAEPTDVGDVTRWRLVFTPPGGQSVALAPDVTSYMFVTRDSRWIFFEPIDVVDVTTWRRYRLSDALGVKPYVVPRAISADGRRLVISRGACPFDCREIPLEYYEIGFPPTK